MQRGAGRLSLLESTTRRLLAGEAPALQHAYLTWLRCGRTLRRARRSPSNNSFLF